MTDAQFQKSINKAIAALANYHSCLSVAEKEYERRFGHSPSDADDDTWIDSLHVNPQYLSVEQVKESASDRKVRFQNY